MNDTTNNGGPAFPILQDGCQFPRAEGMTLRDYFAAKAMQAHIAASFPALAAAMQKDTDRINEVIAMSAYETADAMLKAGGQA